MAACRRAPSMRKSPGAHLDAVHADVTVGEGQRRKAAAGIRPGAGQRRQRVVMHVQADQLRVSCQHIRQRPAC